MSLLLRVLVGTALLLESECVRKVVRWEAVRVEHVRGKVGLQLVNAEVVHDLFQDVRVAHVLLLLQTLLELACDSSGGCVCVLGFGLLALDELRNAGLGLLVRWPDWLGWHAKRTQRRFVLLQQLGLLKLGIWSGCRYGGLGLLLVGSGVFLIRRRRVVTQAQTVHVTACQCALYQQLIACELNDWPISHDWILKGRMANALDRLQAQRAQQLLELLQSDIRAQIRTEEEALGRHNGGRARETERQKIKRRLVRLASPNEREMHWTRIRQPTFQGQLVAALPKARPYWERVDVTLWTKRQLDVACALLDLPTGGKKMELIAQIQDWVHEPTIRAYREQQDRLARQNEAMLGMASLSYAVH